MKQKKKTVVLITTRLFPDVGGVAKYCYNFVKGIKTDGFSIVVIAPCPKGYSPKSVKVSESLELIYMPITSINHIKPSIFEQIKYSLLFTIRGFLELLKIRKNHEIRLIHAQSPWLTAIPALLYKLIQRVPYYYTYHGVDYRSSLEFFIDFTFVYRFAKKIFVITEQMKKYFRYYKMDKINEPIHTSNGIDSKNMQTSQLMNLPKHEIYKKINLEFLDETKETIIYVGIMNLKQKTQGMMDFALAFNNFLNTTTYPNKNKLHLIYLGSGEYYDELQSFVDNLEHKSQIHLVGYRKDVNLFYATATLSGLTSYTEGFPNVLLEAMLFGVPCIGSITGDIPNIIGDTGFLVKAGNIPQIQKALNTFFSMSIDEKNELKAKSKQRIEQKFDWDIVSSQLANYYSKELHK